MTNGSPEDPSPGSEPSLTVRLLHTVILTAFELVFCLALLGLGRAIFGPGVLRGQIFMGAMFSLAALKLFWPLPVKVEPGMDGRLRGAIARILMFFAASLIIQRHWP